MGTIYKRNGSDFFYCRYKDRTGRTVRESTGTTDELQALEYLERVEGVYKRMTLKSAILPYTDPETNPRRHDAEIDGRMYGKEHALHVAAFARDMLQDIPENLLNKQVSRITRLDCKQIKEALYNRYGATRTAQQRFQIFKTIFTQLEEDGLILASPARGLRNIGYAKRERFAIDSDRIARLIAKRELFYSDIEWAFFTILATTGMRISEVLCLNAEKIRDGALIIDEAIKGTDGELGRPKMNKSRVIPLAGITQKAINALTPDAEGYYFPRSRNWGKTIWAAIKRTALAACPDEHTIWEQATPHIMRHSLNSNLLGAGVQPVLVAAYISWMSRELDDIQRRYTHIITDDLQPVARMIDLLYSPQPEDNGKILKFAL